MAARKVAVRKDQAVYKIRGMGCHEAYQLAMLTHDQYRGTVVACQYTVPSTSSRPENLALLKTRFHNALARVVLAQPHLQTGIVGEHTKSPFFVILDRLDLRKHVQWVTLDDASQSQQLYLETMQTQLDAQFDNLSTQPGWRVVVLQETGTDSMTVIYTWNHTIHDGMSGKIFHQSLLRHLKRASNPNEAPLVNVSSDSEKVILKLPWSFDKLPPNPELLSSWRISPSVLLPELWKGLKPESLFPPGGKHAHWAPIRASPYQTSFRNFTVPDRTVTKLVEVCRAHQTTLTGLLQALCLVSLSTALPNTRGFASRTPYDLRQILPSHTKKFPWLQPKEAMCNYVSVVEHEFDGKLVDSIRAHMPSAASDAKLSTGMLEILWAVSARVRREIKARLDAGTRNDLIGVMKWCPDWNSQQRSEMRRTRYLSWLVTNLGVIDGESSDGGEEEGGKWSLRRAELALSAETPSAALSVSVMTVKGREMCVTCSWQDCVVEREVGEGLTRNLERWVNEIGA